MKMIKTLLAALVLGCSLVPLAAQTGAAPAVPQPQISEAQARQKLMMAYRREFIFLDQELRALKKRQTELNSMYVEKKSKSKVDIDVLEQRLLTLRDQLDMKDKLVTQKEEVIEQAQANADLVDVALSQMQVSLERYGIGLEMDIEKMEGGAEKLAAIDTLFKDAFKVMSTINDTVVEDGEFYDSEGKQLKGKIVKLGQSAAYGVAGDKGGVLAPAGEGKLFVWSAEGLGAAKAFVSGSTPSTSYPIYVYEDIKKKALKIEEKTFSDTMEAGGAIGWVIVGLGAVAMLMVVVRFLLLASASSNTKSLVSAVGGLIKEGKNDEALQFLEGKGNAASRVLSSTIKHIHYKPAQLEDVIAESVLHETPTLDRFGSAITVVAAVAPLLGLLGTVTGMISTFDVITIHGTGDPKMLSGGISEALVTTRLGLTVAIPLLLLGNLLSGWSEKILSGLETSALSVTNISRN